MCNCVMLILSLFAAFRALLFFAFLRFLALAWCPLSSVQCLVAIVVVSQFMRQIFTVISLNLVYRKLGMTFSPCLVLLLLYTVFSYVLLTTYLLQKSSSSSSHPTIYNALQATRNNCYHSSSTTVVYKYRLVICIVCCIIAFTITSIAAALTQFESLKSIENGRIFDGIRFSQHQFYFYTIVTSSHHSLTSHVPHTSLAPLQIASSLYCYHRIHVNLFILLVKFSCRC